jgi:hypothetical protein
MPLTPKSRFKLVQRLKTVIYDADQARAALTNAGIPTGNLNFQGSILVIWTGIVSVLETTRNAAGHFLLEVFLQDIVENKYPNDEIFKLILEELRNNYTTKLKLLAKAIKVGQCVLFLGPKIFLARQGSQLISFNELLAEVIVRQFDENTYYDETQANNLNYVAQLLSNMDDYIAGDQGRLAQTLYEKLKNEGVLETRVYEKLADLPFRLVINTNPDDQLATIINQQHPSRCVIYHYDPSRTEYADDQPSLPIGTTLHYNLLGTIADPVSIQMTESQLLEFTSRIINGKPPLDRRVRLAFGENTYYLFLGFDFDQWYMKLVVAMVLKLVKQKGGRAFSTFSANTPFSAFNREFYEDEFKFYFINEEDIQKFVKLLVDAYKILP